MAVKINTGSWRRRRGMAKLLDALGAGDGLTRFVGGAVRDQLLEIPVSDIDLATRLRPEAVVERLRSAGIKAVPTGIDHGTITAVSDGHPVEVTTLRRDVSTDGRRATVAFTDDWKEDAARRDFTINALMADPVSGEVFDYFGGLADIDQRRVRFIGNPLERIAEDHLRILRFFRFHARFGDGEPDSFGLEACAARANDLMALSRERIADEILKLLDVADPSPTVELMVGRGILAPVLPEIGPDGVSCLRELVFAEARSGLAGDALRRLTALLLPDAEAAERVAVRLKLSNRARKRIRCAASRQITSETRALAYQVGVECAVDRLLLAGRGEDAAAISAWVPPRLPIGGGALIGRGVPQGPEVARMLRRVEQRWVAAGFPEGEAFEAIVADCVADR